MRSQLIFWPNYQNKYCPAMPIFVLHCTVRCTIAAATACIQRTNKRHHIIQIHAYNSILWYEYYSNVVYMKKRERERERMKKTRFWYCVNINRYYQSIMSPLMSHTAQHSTAYSLTALGMAIAMCDVCSVYSYMFVIRWRVWCLCSPLLRCGDIVRPTVLQ